MTGPDADRTLPAVRDLNPAQTLVLLFAGVVLLGTGLLALPMASPSGTSIGFVDALFTATSAVCVTGLAVLDTPVDFTPFGLMVILALIQVGGLGIMTFGLLFIQLLSGRRVGLADQIRLKEDRGTANLGEVADLLRQIAFWVLLVETIGAALLLPVFLASPAGPLGPLGDAFFHSVSAFCNAGFALRSDSLMAWAGSWYLNLVIMGLIVLGGLGFGVLREFSLAVRYKARRTWFGFPGEERNPFHLSYHAKLALWTSAILALAGTLLFLWSEANHTLRTFDRDDRVIRAMFLSITARTAGFNTVPTEALGPASVWLLILLMAIGASPGGSGGGLKTTTVAVLYASLRQEMRGGGEVVLSERTIPDATVRRANALVFSFLFLWGVASFALCLIEPFRLDEVLFEVVSALSTVGLSMGITAKLSPIGKLVIVSLMFVGRVGPMTMVLGLRPGRERGRVKFAQATGLVIG